MNNLGFRMARTSLAAIEQGRRELKLDELFGLTLVFGLGIGEFIDRGLDELGLESWVRLGRVSVARRLLLTNLRGTDYEWAKNRDLDVTMELLRERGFITFSDDELDAADRLDYESNREAERHAAEVLHLRSAREVSLAAHKLWGRGFTEERNSRADGRSDKGDRRTGRGHATRQMIQEIDEYLKELVLKSVRERRDR
jgi:hypothetical protein